MEMIVIVLAAVIAVLLLLLWLEARSVSASVRALLTSRRIEAAYRLFDVRRSETLEQRLREAGHKLKVDFAKVLSRGEAELVANDKGCRVALSRYLNDLEMFCVAFRTGEIDTELAYQLHGARIVTKYEYYKAFIARIREESDQPRLLIEFETLAREWKKRARGSDKAEEGAVRTNP